MPASRPCPQCGSLIPAGASEGLCPRCLLALNLAAQSHMAGDTQPSAGNQAVPLPPLEEVAKLFPQLEIIRLVGTGGMGAVYQARQPALDRFVALKLLHTPPANDPGFAERFAQEARALAKLNHPNIVALYESGQAGGRPYFLMEFVDGLNLRQLQQAGRLSPREALQIVPQVCDALQYAHDEGIVHRDIKPENVLIDRKGRVKVADFGLAKLMGRETAATRLTGAGHTMGTPHYMAPEQVEHPLEVDHRADIFSLGVVFYELLTGELPLGKFPVPSKKVRIDVRLDEVVLRALEKEPALRYGQASELKTRVETIAQTPEEKKSPEATNVSQDSADNGKKTRSLRSWAWRLMPAVAVLLAFFNPWGTRSWYWFAAACAVLAVLPGFRRPRIAHVETQPVVASKAKYKKYVSWAAFFLVVGIVIFGVRTFIIAPYHVPTSAVSPEIPRGSLIFVFKLARHFSTGDIIVYRLSPNEIRVGRVTQGDVVNGILYIEHLGAPQQVSAADIIGKVVFNTRAEPVEVFPEGDRPAKEQGAVADAGTWLALMDKGDYAQSWGAAAESFHHAVTQAEWTSESEKIRRPLGDVLSRKLVTTQETKTFPGMPDGAYWLVEYDTSFAGQKSAAETVVFMCEKDDHWRAISYLIRPRTEAERTAVVAARAWLTSIDEGYYAESWSAASAFFRDAPLTQEKWVAALKDVRQPLGARIFRTVNATRTASNLPGAPGGTYVVMRFDASFAEDKSAVETVTFMLEKDGAWRAAGYYIK